MKKPKKVSNALILLWVSLALGIIANLFDWVTFITSSTSVIIRIVSVLVAIFFIIMIGNKQNWARIFWLILFIIGIPGIILSLYVLGNPYQIIFIFGQTVLQLIALVFLFHKESNKWFRSK